MNQSLGTQFKGCSVQILSAGKGQNLPTMFREWERSLQLMIGKAQSQAGDQRHFISF